MILHKGEPFKIVLAVRNVAEEVNRFTFKNTEDSLLLLGPRPRVDAKRHEVPRQRAEERYRSVSLTAKCPVLVRRIADHRKIFFPRFEPYYLVRPVAFAIARSHRCRRSDPMQRIGIRGRSRSV